MSYEILTENFVRWAAGCDDIRTAVISGSRARESHGADAFSDMDVMIYADHARDYIDDAGWLKHIGETWIVQTNTVGDREPLVRVLFDGGFIVDFFIYPRKMMQHMIRDNKYPRCFHQGARLLVDKDGNGSRIIPPAFSPLPLRPPTQDEFVETVESFLYLALHTAKKLLRGELWLVQSWDGKLKEHLLLMMQWHVRAHKGWETDTWYSGHFLEQWADKQTVEELKETFARYDAADCRRALWSTIHLFCRLSEEFSETLAYPYPGQTVESVCGWLERHISNPS